MYFLDFYLFCEITEELTLPYFAVLMLKFQQNMFLLNTLFLLDSVNIYAG